MLGASRMKNLLIILALLGLTVSCVDRHGVIGAILRLRDDSPLPSWVVLPQGTPRNQVSITIVDYEATTTPRYKFRFVIRNKRRWIFKTIQEQMGVGYWHPDSDREKSPASIYPHWVIIEVNGTKEVYEQLEHNDLLKIVKK